MAANDQNAPKDFVGEHYTCFTNDPVENLHFGLRGIAQIGPAPEDPNLPEDCASWILVDKFFNDRGFSVFVFHAPDCTDELALLMLRYLIIYYGA